MKRWGIDKTEGHQEMVKTLVRLMEENVEVYSDVRENVHQVGSILLKKNHNCTTSNFLKKAADGG